MNKRWLKYGVYLSMTVALFIGVTCIEEVMLASENEKTSKSTVTVRLIEGNETGVKDEKNKIEPKKDQDSKNLPITGNTGKHIEYTIAGIFIVGIVITYYLAGRKKKQINDQ